jgi:hypothetical protein
MTTEQLVAFIKKNPISAACGVISLGLAVALYWRSDVLPEAEELLARKSAEADRYAANIKNSALLNEQLEELVAAVKELDGRLVQASQLGVNNQYFFKLESDTGTKLIDFHQRGIPATKGPKTNFSPVAFTVALQGDLPQLLSFLRLLENGTHYARVNSATCSLAGVDRGGRLTLSLSLELLGVP